MNYVDSKIEQLKQNKLKDLTLGKKGTVTPLKEFLDALDRSLAKYPMIRRNLYVYYERTYGKRNIIAFKMRTMPSYLIYSAKISKRHGELNVKLEAVEGEEGTILLHATFDKMLGLFKSLDAWYKERPETTLSSCTISLHNGISRVRNNSVETAHKIPQNRIK